MADSTALVDLAEELGVQKQWLFKIVKRLEIQPGTRRQGDRAGQRVSIVTSADAARIRAEVAKSRSKERAATNPASANGYGESGFFYIVQLEPDHDAGRFKVGFTLDLEERIAKHRTAAPFSTYRHHWPCLRTWERAAIDCVTSSSELLKGEVYRTNSLDDVVARGHQFFELMPGLRVAAQSS